MEKFFEFTFIEISQEIIFKILHIKPLEGHKLAEKIKMNHVYLTASINEPGGIIILKVGYVACQFCIEKVALYQNTVKILEFVLMELEILSIH